MSDADKEKDLEVDNEAEQEGDQTLLRLRQIIGCPKRKLQPMLPVSASKWWKLVRTGQIPKQIKIGKNAYWLKSDVTQFIKNAAKNR